MKKHIPNFLTCCNLVCGCVGVIYILGAPTTSSALMPAASFTAAYFVWAACVFDFFDGFAARLLHVSSAIGKELDSLADMVSFGLLPGILMFKLIESQLPNPDLNFLPYVSLLLVIFSALRLAIFNVDETQHDSFRGLPTPANAIFITALPFLNFDLNIWILLFITILFSFLMVSHINLFALKFKNFSWNDNKLRFTFLIVSALLIAIFQQAALPVIIILYIVLSLTKQAVA
jgi:CDP-diacylglycerol--serine O-phosphatidyltransferase